MKNNNDFILTVPVFKNAKQIYFNPLLQRNEILTNLKNKSGVYCWVNMLNGKSYIGSAVNLNNRINDYFQEHYYYSKQNSLIIVKAIIRYGLDNFALIILNITDENNIIVEEQSWLDLIKPEYNILKIAANSKCYKNKPEDIEKIREKALGRKHSEEVRRKMSENRKGIKNNFYGKTHSEETKIKLREVSLKRTKLPKPGFKVEIKKYNYQWNIYI